MSRASSIQKKFNPSWNSKKPFWAIFLLFCLIFTGDGFLYAQSLDLAIDNKGLSIGNSKKFTGLRINVIDSEVEEINGVNLTLWRPRNNEEATVNGISVGLVYPEAGYLSGIQIGGLGVAAKHELKGISLGLLGVGSGGNVSGIAIGGLGAGAGENLRGFTVGLLGAGAGNNITGIAIGGLGVGAGGNMKGISFGLLGAGAGGNITGITIGGLGAGAGGNITGVTIGGLGAGCGNELTGITIGGIGVGGREIRGVTLALGRVNAMEEGSMTGFSASIYNEIKGRQHGVTLGIYNMAYELNGVQIGIINHIRDNPRHRKILPIINWNFD